MSSLYDDVAEKLSREPKASRQSMSRIDMGLLMFNARDDIRDLWLAAEAELGGPEDQGHERLRGAVEKLRPIFGEHDSG